MDHIPKLTMRIILAMVLAFGTAQISSAMDGPDAVELNALAELYGPVNFDHTMHTDIAGDCAVCHHHTTGTPPQDPRCAKCHAKSGPADEVACQSCHAAKRFEAEYLNKLAADNTIYHVDRLGLKAAYHQRCMGCHEESGAPNGCQDCHTRNDAGDKVFHAGQYAPPPSAHKAKEGH